VRPAPLDAAVLSTLLTLVLAASAAAQPPVRGRVDVAGGVRWIGPIDFGVVPANEITPGGGTRALFETATMLDGSIGVTASVGVRLASQVRAEASVAYNPTALSSSVSGDVEGIPDLTVTSPVKQFLLEGGVAVEPRRWQTRRLVPFLTAGLGYLRQLNDGRTLVQTGSAYYLGGGAAYVRTNSGRRRLKATGMRVELRALILREGVAPDTSGHLAPALSASVFARF
jgi:hypothetical protein